LIQDKLNVSDLQGTRPSLFSSYQTRNSFHD